MTAYKEQVCDDATEEHEVFVYLATWLIQMNFMCMSEICLAVSDTQFALK